MPEGHGINSPQGRWWTGMILLLFGVVALGINLGFFPNDWVAYWPIALIVAGLSFLF